MLRLRRGGGRNDGLRRRLVQPDSEVGGAARYGLAALTAKTAKATSWQPDPDGSVYVIEPAGGTICSEGSSSTSAAGIAVYVAALNAKTGGRRSAWNPAPDSSVNALAIGSAAVYAGGAFSIIGGTTPAVLIARQPQDGRRAAVRAGVMSP